MSSSSSSVYSIHMTKLPCLVSSQQWLSFWNQETVPSLVSSYPLPHVVGPHRPSLLTILPITLLIKTKGLVPHVHPHANGLLSGIVGAIGNMGGIVFSIIFRFNGKNYAKSIWITGIITILLHLITCWVKPLPKGQIGGR